MKSSRVSDVEDPEFGQLQSILLKNDL